MKKSKVEGDTMLSDGGGELVHQEGCRGEPGEREEEGQHVYNTHEPKETEALEMSAN